MEPNTTPEIKQNYEVAPNGVEGHVQVDARDVLPSVGAETMGVVGEVLSEKPVGMGVASPGAGQGAAQAAKKVAQVKAALLREMPKEAVARRQIEREIEKEIKYLHKKAMKMSRGSGNVSFFEMTNILKKMRELREILEGLVKASVDTVKTLWLRFVHGLM